MSGNSTNYMNRTRGTQYSASTVEWRRDDGARRTRPLVDDRARRVGVAAESLRSLGVESSGGAHHSTGWRVTSETSAKSMSTRSTVRVDRSATGAISRSGIEGARCCPRPGGSTARRRRAPRSWASGTSTGIDAKGCATRRRVVGGVGEPEGERAGPDRHCQRASSSRSTESYREGDRYRGRCGARLDDAALTTTCSSTPLLCSPRRGKPGLPTAQPEETAACDSLKATDSGSGSQSS